MTVRRRNNRLKLTLAILPWASFCVSFRFYSRVIALKVCLLNLFISSIIISSIILWQSNLKSLSWNISLCGVNFLRKLTQLLFNTH